MSTSKRQHAKPGKITAAMKASLPQTVSFGSVTIRGVVPNPAEVEANIKAGHAAFARAKNIIIKKGVKLSFGPNVPLFSADPDQPDRLIRLLNGKQEKGIFVKGKFKKTDK